MTDQSTPDETTVSWLAVPANAPVLANDGTEVGKVLEVASLPEDDIFHGIVFQHHGRGRGYLAPASAVERITDKAVHLNVDAAETEKFAEFHEESIRRLGLTGVFRWKHFGWKDSSE